MPAVRALYSMSLSSPTKARRLAWCKLFGANTGRKGGEDAHEGVERGEEDSEEEDEEEDGGEGSGSFGLVISMSASGDL